MDKYAKMSYTGSSPLLIWQTKDSVKADFMCALQCSNAQKVNDRYEIQ